MAKKLGDLLQRSIRSAGIDKEVNAAIVCTAFDRLLEEKYPRLHGQAQAKYVKNGTLSIQVMSSVVGQEIKLREMDILDFLQGKFGEQMVQRLRFLL